MPDSWNRYVPNSLRQASGELLMHMGPAFARRAVKARRVDHVADDVIVVRMIIGVRFINKVLSP